MAVILNNVNIAPTTGAALIFWAYFEGTGTIPAGTFGLATTAYGLFGAPSTNERPINVDLVGGVWTKVTFPLDVSLGDFQVNSLINVTQWGLGLLKALDNSLFDGDSEVKIRLANGRIEKTSTMVVGSSPLDPLDFSGGAYGPVPASVISTAALTSDFTVGVLADIATGLVSLGSNCRFTCAGVRPSADCTSDVQAPGPNFMGDREGFVNMVFDDKVLTWGSPSNRFVFPALASGPGSPTTFVIDQSFAGTAGALSLALDADQNGLLAGLVCAKVPASASGVSEFRRIASNTGAAVTVSPAWEWAPAAGDTLIVAPLGFMVQWAETVYPRPTVLRAFRAIFAQLGIATVGGWASRFTPRLRLEQFIAGGRGDTVTDLVADAEKWFTADEFAKGTGGISFSGRSSKAQSIRLSTMQGDDAPIALRAPTVEERG